MCVFVVVAVVVVVVVVVVVEGCLDVKLPTLWTGEAAEVGRVSEEKKRRKKIREKKETEEIRSKCAKW